jgi:hypothetical protein
MVHHSEFFFAKLKNAPPPTVYRVGNHTSLVSLNFTHSMMNADGTFRHTHLSYDVVKNNNAGTRTAWPTTKP